jgi:hypothetical protein
MRAWRFDQARTMLGDAATILDQRATIATGAAAAGLTVPDTLRTAFESPDGFATATLEATAELAAIDGYEAAVAARQTSIDTIESIGLWGMNPEGDLDRARTLFASGDLGGAAGAAGAAESAWAGAAEAGQARLMSLGLLVLAVLLGLVILAISLRGRRPRPTGLASAVAVAVPAAAASSARGAFPGWDDDDDTTAYEEPAMSGTARDLARPDPYATLAASPDPARPVEVGDEGARGAEPD